MEVEQDMMHYPTASNLEGVRGMSGPTPPERYEFGTKLGATKIHLMPVGWKSSLCGLMMAQLCRQATTDDQVCQNCLRELDRPRIKKSFNPSLIG